MTCGEFQQTEKSENRLLSLIASGRSPFRHCDDAPVPTSNRVSYCLVLRRWVDISPGSEYRAFVRDGRLVVVSQRDGTNHYAHIAAERSSIVGVISSFFEEFIATAPLSLSGMQIKRHLEFLVQIWVRFWDNFGTRALQFRHALKLPTCQSQENFTHWNGIV